MPRGGYREGAGRKSPWNSSETQTIRVPIALAEQLLEIAKKLDKEEQYDFVSKSYCREKLEKLAEQVLTNPIVTRNGKDKGAVKRGLEAMINLLLSDFETKSER